MEDLVIEDGATSALEITLGDFLVFINWMNQTEKSLDRAELLAGVAQPGFGWAARRPPPQSLEFKNTTEQQPGFDPCSMG